MKFVRHIAEYNLLDPRRNYILELKVGPVERNSTV
jgi:hypothetical protein